MTKTIWRKLLASTLALVLALSYIPAVPLTAEAVEGSPSTSLSGSGTADVPFEIASAADLAYMRDQVNASGTITPSGDGAGVTANTAHYKLTADIVLGYWQDDGDGIVEDGEIYDSDSGGTAYSASNWTPIGSSSTITFQGIFDGDGHTVSGIYIKREGTGDEAKNLGLFGCVKDGTVKNVGVKDSYIKGYSPLGGVVGSNQNGTVQNCYNTGSINGTGGGGVVGSNANGTVEDCYNTGSVVCTIFSGNAGGIIGYNSGGTVKNCHNAGSVNGNYKTGGVVGSNMNNGTINNCSNSGSVSGSGGTDGNGTGGVVGYSSGGTIEYCYNTGSVSGSSSYLATGGVVGYSSSDTKVKNCYNTGSVKNTSNGSNIYVGGIVGKNNVAGNVESCYNTGSVSGTTNVGGVAGNSTGTVTGCNYDKQMCPVGGINGGDIEGSAEGKLTAEMTSVTPFPGWSSGETGAWNFTANLYPRLTGYVDASTDYKMDETSVALVAASPVFLASTDTAVAVKSKSNFTLSTELGVTWSSSNENVISISGSDATVEGDGSVTLTASLEGAVKSVTLIVDGNAPTLLGVERISYNTKAIRVTLNEPCLNLSNANDGGFTVTETGTSTTFAVSKTAQGADAKKVMLTVADIATASAKGVTVTYTAGANGIITDLVGNPLATNSTGVKISPWAPKLSTPGTLSWDETTPAKATWGAVANASSYTVQLYKGGTACGSSVTGIANNYHDFTDVITETGSYTFTVQAIGNGTTYLDSDVSSPSSSYAYTALIKAATVTIAAPAAGAAPQTAEQVETATANADYTVTNVVWNELLTAGDKFKAGQEYTASVTLTSKNGKEFQAAAFTPTVDSASAVGETTTTGTGIGNKVTFTVTFAATEAQSVTAIAVKTQPTKLIYTAGDTLDLTGLVVTLTYNDGSTADILYDQFSANGITANPDQGTAMEITAHNGQAITLTCNALTATTGNLTVSAPPTYEITLSENGTYTFTAQTAGYTPVASVTVTVTRTGTGNITNLAAALSGAASGDFTLGALDAATLDGTTTSATFTVKPNDALAPGTYPATVTVTADNGVSQGFNLSFTVNAPSAPTIQSAAAGDTLVNITWSSVPGATGYKVYQSTTSGTYGAELATVAGAVYGYEATGLANGTTYYFVVRTSIGIYDSVNSNEVSATPQVPAPGAPVLQTAVPGNGQVSLTWSAVEGSLGYNTYASMTSGVYTSPVDTVTGSVYSCDVTGLVNGTTYYFAVTASNPGGESGYSNEISVTPQAAAPGAPTGVTAAGGNTKVSLSWNSTAGAAGYKIYQSTTPGSYGTALATVAGDVYSYEAEGLTNGVVYYFVIKASNAGGDSPYSAEVTATPYRPSSGGSGDSSTPSTPPAQPANPGVEILINGKAETAATATTTQEGDKTVTTVVVDDEKVEERLEQEGSNAVVTILVNNGADVVIGTLNGQTVRNMENLEAVLEIITGSVTYTLPASQINIDAEQIGKQLELKDIAVSVKISEPTADTVKIVEDTANKNNYQIVVKPVEFEITCSSGNKTVEVSKFSVYVKRLVAIPEGIDPSKITTGIILNEDGSFSHVPTAIIIIDGKYYAKVNSLTNSVYSVIYSPKAFQDVEAHWAKDAVNDMGSRLVISGVGEDKFEPDRDITRAEFAAIAVRALGLMRPGTGKDVFNDVPKDAWYYDAVAIAYEYDLIAGYGSGQFGPMDKITREQAMTMVARAMKITKLEAGMTDSEESKVLAAFTDANSTADYAKTGIAACVKTGIISGRSQTTLAPKDDITRAEVAVIVRRLLQQSGLI